MSAPLKVSAVLSASIERMRARTWRDADAAAFEQGAIPTRAAATRPLIALAPVHGAGIPHRFKPRQRPRSPDRAASRARRRRFGGSSALPPNIRHFYTEGQRAVLCIIGGEVKRRGVCDFPIDKIAALAGVGRTTTQTAMREAERLGHLRITERPQPGRKHLPHLIAVASAEWLTWIKKGAAAHGNIGSNSVKKANPTKIEVSNNSQVSRGGRPQRALQGNTRAGPEASRSGGACG